MLFLCKGNVFLKIKQKYYNYFKHYEHLTT